MKERIRAMLTLLARERHASTQFWPRFTSVIIT